LPFLLIGSVYNVGQPTLSTAEWGMVYSLALMWQMHKLLREIEVTLGKLFTQDTAPQQVHMSIKYENLSQWFSPGVEMIIQRELPLTADEMGNLGYELVASINCIRERHREERALSLIRNIRINPLLQDGKERLYYHHVSKDIKQAICELEREQFPPPQIVTG
jgi:hypothetical protein